MCPIIKLKYVSNLLYLLQFLLLKTIKIWQLFEPVDRARYRKLVKESFNIVYNSVSQPSGRGPVLGPGINYTGPREA
jgi:hypothetical protein